MLNNVQAVMFDMDGTLIDSKKWFLSQCVTANLKDTISALKHNLGNDFAIFPKHWLDLYLQEAGKLIT